MDFPQLVRRTLSLAGDPFAIQLGLFEAEIDRTADFPERLYAELEKYGAKRLVLQAQRVAMTLSWDVVHFPVRSRTLSRAFLAVQFNCTRSWLAPVDSDCSPDKKPLWK